MRISDWSSDVCSSDLAVHRGRRHDRATALCQERPSRCGHPHRRSEVDRQHLGEDLEVVLVAIAADPRTAQQDIEGGHARHERGHRLGIGHVQLHHAYALMHRNIWTSGTQSHGQDVSPELGETKGCSSTDPRRPSRHQNCPALEQVALPAHGRFSLSQWISVLMPSPGSDTIRIRASGPSSSPTTSVTSAARYSRPSAHIWMSSSWQSRYPTLVVIVCSLLSMRNAGTTNS